MSGNAADWWAHAAGLYERGNRPEPGSVLNFRANGRMRLGHVSVVTSVVNDREIEVDHANWSYGGGRGAISRSVHVIDVSPVNDWTAVRVELGHTGQFGSIYPTFGFIYGRPDGTPAPRLIEEADAAPLPALNPAPSDLRPLRERKTALLPVRSYDQVAEAPATGIDFSVPAASLNFDAPDRDLR